MSSAPTAGRSTSIPSGTSPGTGTFNSPAARFLMRVGLICGAVIFLTNPYILALRIPAAIQETFTRALGLAAYPLQGEFILLVLISLIGGAIWSAVAGNRWDGRTLWELLLVEWRFVLAAAMLLSGLQKTLHVQMPWPTPPDWIRPIREMPSLYYVKVWIGSSGLHETMLGLTELAAGVALLFIRTVTLGALIALMTVGNGVMIAISFDNIRAGSYWPLAQLAGLAQLLVIADLKRIVTFFAFEDQAPDPPRINHDWAAPALQRADRVAKPLFLSAIAVLMIPTVRRGIDAQQRSPLRGAYSVEQLLVDGQPLDPFAKSTLRWRLVGIDDCRRFAARTHDDRQIEAEIVGPAVRSLHQHADCATNTSANTGALTLQPTKNPLGLVEPGLTGQLRYTRTGDQLELDGTIDGKKLAATLRRLPDSTFKITHYPNWQ